MFVGFLTVGSGVYTGKLLYEDESSSTTLIIWIILTIILGILCLTSLAGGTAGTIVSSVFGYREFEK